MGGFAAALGLGTAALGVRYGAPQGERDAVAPGAAVATVVRALERGVRFIDTAPAYGDAEALVGEAAAGADCVVATKLAIPQRGWAALSDAEVREHVRVSAQRSQAALRRDRLDVLAVHNADPELLGRAAIFDALDELRAEGVVGAIGATVYGPDHALAAVASGRVEVVQLALNALERSAERAVLPAAAGKGVRIVARSVLLRGVLTEAGRALSGPFAPLAAAADGFRRAAGVSWEQLAGAATAFVATRPGVDHVLLGPRDSDELDDLIDTATECADRVSGLDDDWARDVPSELLDPRAWPGLEGTA